MHRRWTGWMKSLLFGALLFPLGSQALIVDRLYETQLVAGTKAADKNALLAEGLEQVLTRVSGKPDVVNHPLVQQALKKPNDYVQQFSFQGDNFEATFSPGMIHKLLTEAQFPIWSNNRPVLVMWLAIDTEKERRLVGAESQPGIVALIDQMAQVRGLPVVVPLMDLEDMSRVTVTDVWGQFPSVLQQASMRYGHDGILVGRLSSHDTEAGPIWETRWELLIDGDTYQWQSEGVGLNLAIKAGVDGVVDHLANLFAVQSGDSQRQAILIGVEDVYSVDDYAKVLKYLRGLNPVEDVLVHSVEPDRTIFKVVPKNGSHQQAIKQAIDLDQNMVNLARSSAEEALDVNYRWISRGI